MTKKSNWVRAIMIRIKWRHINIFNLVNSIYKLNKAKYSLKKKQNIIIWIYPYFDNYIFYQSIMSKIDKFIAYSIIMFINLLITRG